MKNSKNRCLNCGKEIQKNRKFCSRSCVGNYRTFLATKTYVCPICGLTFKRKPKTIKTKTPCCSTECARKLRVIKESKSYICPICKKKFIRNSVHAARSSKPCCSHSCAAQYRYRYKKQINCLNCNKKFKPSKPTQIYCSNKCYIEHKKDKNMRECPVCKKKFHSNKKQKCCSRSCAAKLRTQKSRLIFICPICNKKFERVKSLVKEGVIPCCSHSCSAKLKTRMLTAKRKEYICPECGKKFSRKPSAIKTDKPFCSKSCQAKHLDNLNVKNPKEGKNHPGWRGGQITKTCQVCNQKYEVPAYKKDSSQYCSIECKQNAWKMKYSGENAISKKEDSKEKCICQYCGKEFEEYKSHVKRGQGKYCCREHAGMAKRGDYYIDNSKNRRENPEYKDWREKVFNRDGFKCVVCGSNSKIEAHHIWEWRDYPLLRYDVTNGQTLCEDCHKKVHRKQQYKKKRRRKNKAISSNIVQ